MCGMLLRKNTFHAGCQQSFALCLGSVTHSVLDPALYPAHKVGLVVQNLGSIPLVLISL